MAVKSAITHEKDERIPPRSGFSRWPAICFIGMESGPWGSRPSPSAAGTNKMTLYRHFASKDESGGGVSAPISESWPTSAGTRFAQAHPGDPLAQLRAWLAEMASHVACSDERGCPLANAAVELPEKDHPARRVIEEFKVAQRARLVELSRSAGLSEPDMLADELHPLLEGARVTAQSVGADGLGARLVRTGEAMIAAHAAK